MTSQNKTPPVLFGHAPSGPRGSATSRPRRGLRELGAGMGLGAAFGMGFIPPAGGVGKRENNHIREEFKKKIFKESTFICPPCGLAGGTHAPCFPTCPTAHHALSSSLGDSFPTVGTAGCRQAWCSFCARFSPGPPGVPRSDCLSTQRVPRSSAPCHKGWVS